jgi:hypothetical protein
LAIAVRDVEQLELDEALEAFELLAERDPLIRFHFENVFRNLVEIRVGPCPPGATACTGGPLSWRVATLSHEQMGAGTREIILSIAHEAMHYFLGPDGRFRLVQHTCSDCTNPRQRAADAIYRQETVLRLVLIKLGL